MNTKDAYALLEALMDGVNPITDEPLPEDHVCHEPAVLRALHKALVALRNSTNAEAEHERHASGASAEETGCLPQRPRSGTPWTAEDDRLLWDLWQAGTAEEEIARQLQRSSNVIRSRMDRLGMLEPEDAAAPPFLPPWSLEEAQRLRRLYAGGCSAEEIAKQMGLPAESIRARLFYMGLSKKSPLSLHAKETIQTPVRPARKALCRPRAAVLHRAFFFQHGSPSAQPPCIFRIATAPLFCYNRIIMIANRTGEWTWQRKKHRSFSPEISALTAIWTGAGRMKICCPGLCWISFTAQIIPWPTWRAR